MRVVLDTNTVISGLLWLGDPRHLLDAARSGSIELFTSEPLLYELEDVLSRPKFTQRIQRTELASQDLVFRYAWLATVVVPVEILPTVLRDPDDDVVLACAIAAKADVIVSGDNHLLGLKQYRGIPILDTKTLLAQLPPLEA